MDVHGSVAFERDVVAYRRKQGMKMTRTRRHDMVFSGGQPARISLKSTRVVPMWLPPWPARSGEVSRGNFHGSARMAHKTSRTSHTVTALGNGPTSASD